ncbi:uncharacterized protein N7479_010719 [Penicillium vulpinum]|uniref:GPI anchored cell wall protein n=1 Tax=Penicillium vulpinum TaxID=29845 RepID=A0A1V6S8S7_9EURO|nr:uncharacterized protein N7479_010719 [Penicillium vulpinum]KAJ5952306.1 hypothetical protein N7479_010719 [Penicillium vulpinum]OQE10276.1 hypothetical protein PENVUL_c004G05366 [Penicillium vulpinum]
MRVQALALLAGATAAALAAETVTLFLPGYNNQEIEGEVLGTIGSMTKYRLNCAVDFAFDKCKFPGGISMDQGPSTISMSYGKNDITFAQSCTYDSKTAKCSTSFDEMGLISSWNSAITFTDVPGGVFVTVTITATGTDNASATTGASVSASTAASTGSATLTTSAFTSIATLTDSASASTATGTSTASESSDSSSAAATSATETGNAAMPMITGNARWAAGGVAAALALAAL